MRTTFIKLTALAAILAPALAILVSTAQADSFGSGTNAFTIDFVAIGDAGNAADSTGYGAVSYNYRIATYEVSQNMLTKAYAGGLTNVAGGSWSGDKSATQDWYDAAAFVNWLNTSTGHTNAYDLTWNGSAWSMSLWSSGDAWQAGGENLYRHKDAYYFLPSENEWYKAAYYNGTNYYDYATGSDVAPTAVASGTASGTAVYNGSFFQGPADVNDAGGLSPYGTMAQSGNVWEWSESAYDGTNSSGSEPRAYRGGSFYDNDATFLSSSYRDSDSPDYISATLGFRVASIPEPSTYALLALGGLGTLLLKRRRKQSAASKR